MKAAAGPKDARRADHQSKPFAARRWFRQTDTMILIGACLVIGTFFSLTTNGFLTAVGLSTMAVQLPEIGLMTLGMMMTMVIRGIDLSINDTANVSAAVAGFLVLFLAKLLPNAHGGGATALMLASLILVALAVGFVGGLLNGLLVGYLGITPVLATLGTLTLYRGITVGITKGEALTNFPEQLSVIGNGTLAGIPISFVIFLGVSVVVFLLLKRTVFGFETRMLGTNPTAARFSGIRTVAITWKVYALSGVLGALAGVIIMSRTSSVSYEYGTQTYVLLAILIGVVSGAEPGFGSALNVVLAVFVFQMLSTGFDMLLVGLPGSSFFKQFAWGMVFVLFFIINTVVRRRRGRS